MNLSLLYNQKKLNGDVILPISKSIANRILILLALEDRTKSFPVLSSANDTQILQQLLNSRDTNIWDVGLAGTACRFLTAYLCTLEGEYILTGADRMKERPISLLVEALRELGAEIHYVSNEGYLPIRIKGRSLVGGVVEISGAVSSQYISALCMIAPYMKVGLTIHLQGELVSKPYIDLTLSLMLNCGAQVDFEGMTISIHPGNYVINDSYVEADWSAASYWYSLIAIRKEGNLRLKGIYEKSLQGDVSLVELYRPLGVISSFDESGVVLSYQANEIEFPSVMDLTDNPDLAQTILVTYAALGIPIRLTGLKTLRIKETDRLEALKGELEKCGASIRIEGNDSIEVVKGVQVGKLSSVSIDTYNDHRMAMAFAPLAALSPISINNAEVVKKSYPEFWEEWGKFFTVSKD